MSHLVDSRHPLTVRLMLMYRGRLSAEDIMRWLFPGVRPGRADESRGGAGGLSSTGLTVTTPGQMLSPTLHQDVHSRIPPASRPASVMSKTLLWRMHRRDRGTYHIPAGQRISLNPATTLHSPPRRHPVESGPWPSTTIHKAVAETSVSYKILEDPKAEWRP